MLPHCSPPVLLQQFVNVFSLVSAEFGSGDCRACSDFLSDVSCLQRSQHEWGMRPAGELEAATRAEAAAVDAEDFEKAAALSAQADAAKARLADLHVAARGADGICERLVCPLPATPVCMSLLAARTCVIQVSLPACLRSHKHIMQHAGVALRPPGCDWGRRACV